jgi:hypothetical protein
MNLQTTSHEREYTAKANLAGALVLAVHLPALSALARIDHVGLLVPLAVMLALLLGPAVLLLQDRSSPLASVAIAAAAMGMSAVAIYVTNGLIEAHFELFVLIALLTVFGRIAPLLVAGIVIALHHVIFWLWLPSGVFNYKASFGTVLLHAFFVVLEVVPACWIARQSGNAIRFHGLVVEDLAGVACQIASAAGQVATASQTLASGASEQAAAIEETSLATFEINATAERNTNGSQQASLLVGRANEKFASTNQALERMVVAMVGIDDSSQQISKIIKVIDEIAFQTNILALNAAVESARAGEAGMGFAVVANEVRSLAQRSANAAQDTSSLIGECVERSRSGRTLIESMAVDIRSLAAESARVMEVVHQIYDGSREQSKGMGQVGRSIQQMERVTQSNAASAQEAAAAAAELKTQAGLIHTMIEQLNALSSKRRTSTPLNPMGTPLIAVSSR